MSENGGQTTVRGKMRHEEVDGEEDQDANPKTNDRVFSHSNLPKNLRD